MHLVVSQKVGSLIRIGWWVEGSFDSRAIIRHALATRVTSLHFALISRYVLGHLLTAIELFEEERVRGQCQNLLRVARRLLGKIGKYLYTGLGGWAE